MLTDKRTMPGCSTNLDGFVLFAETLGEMVSRHAPDGSYSYASPAAQALFGYEPNPRRRSSR